MIVDRLLVWWQDYVFHSTGSLEAKVAASGFLQATFYTEEESQYGSPR
jgi:hypothetical protein